MSVWSRVLTLHHPAFFHHSWSSQMAMKLTFDRHVYWLVSEREPMLLSVNNFSCNLNVFIEASLAMGWWQSQFSFLFLFSFCSKEEEKRDSTRALDELTGAVQWDLLFPPRSTTTCFEHLQSICLLLQFKFIKGLNGLTVAGKPRGCPPGPMLLHVKMAYGKTLFNQIVCDNLILVDQPDLWLILELEKV